MIASQVFVQLSGRISLPLTAQASGFADRWTPIARQIAVLAGATAPILAAALVVVPAIDHHLWADKWQPALGILPFLFIRMLPSTACTPVGTLFLVERGARSYAITSWAWTLGELVAAFGALSWFGPSGLAYSYSVTAWFGLGLFVYGLGQDAVTMMHRIFMNIMVRISVLGPAALVSPYVLALRSGNDPLRETSVATILTAGILIVSASYLADPDLRCLLFKRRQE
jgi:hypothetical protein